MKLFVLVILVATVLGGFVGGELTEKTFSITGAVISGVGLTAILLGLGAFFSAQDEKKRKEKVPQEVVDSLSRLVDRYESAQKRDQ